MSVMELDAKHLGHCFDQEMSAVKKVTLERQDFLDLEQTVGDHRTQKVMIFI